MAHPKLPPKFRSAFCGTDDLKSLKYIARKAPKNCSILVISDGRKLGAASHALICAQFQLHSVSFEYDLRDLEFTGRVVMLWTSRKCIEMPRLSNLFCRSDADLHIKAYVRLPTVVATKHVKERTRG